MEERNEPKSGSTQKGPDLFGYTDFRKYLKDYYEARKASERGYSFRAFSKAAGFSSPNFLKLVIDGSRNISAAAIEKFIQALALKGKHAEYFRLVVRLGQSHEDSEKESIIYLLDKLVPDARRRHLGTENLQYLSNWLYPVIREMLAIPGFRDDPYWISRRINFDVNVQDAANALRFLIQEGFIERGQDDQWKAKDDMVLSSDEVRSLAIRNYHRSMLERAREALDRLELADREFGAVTFVIPDASLDELKGKLKVFRSELHAWAVKIAGESPGDTVVQVNFQMFPHTHKV
jgi:uncharacterized protein (TIGR02147 family)